MRAALLVATVLAASPAFATPSLLASGSLTGSTAGAYADLSGLTGTLENGTPANALGGLGSGLAWAGGNNFVAVPDRGPNAVPFDSAIDDTTSYISRVQSITAVLTPNANRTAFTVVPTLTGTTLLFSPAPLTYGSGAELGTEASGAPLRPGAPAQNGASHSYFTGRSDNFGPGNSGNPANARLDPEGVRVSADGKSVFVSDEYGPYLYQFDRATGARLRTYTLPGNLDVATLSSKGDTEIAANASGRVANKGMEGLAITPDGKTLVGIMQAPLLQDAAASSKLLRIITVDVATGATHEYAYLLTTGTGVSEITAINDHEFLVDERDGKGLGDGSSASVKQLFKIDLTGAVDVTGLDAAAATAVAVKKSLFADLVSILTASGLSRAQVPAKIEGLAFGDDVLVNAGGALTTEHTLWVTNDNDFVPGVAGPNQIFVFGVTDADLGGSPLVPQTVPEPASLLLVLPWLVAAGWGGWRRAGAEF